MFIQRSYQALDGKGVLYLVSTPIGNLDDMTYRAVQVLREADMIAAEDTRQTLKLLNHFAIDKPLSSYHEHNKRQKGSQFIQYLREGKIIALVSDAGMPAISDPGADLVVQCLEEGFHVIPVPGANAALTGLIASGLSTQSFAFFGFPPRHEKEKVQFFEGLKEYPMTLIFYEGPHRIKKTLQTMRKVFGSRKISICRELTKKYEEFIRGNLEELDQWFLDGEHRGEFTIILEGYPSIHRLNPSVSSGSQSEDWWIGLSVHDHVNHYIQQGLRKNEAIKQTALDRGLPKREVYNHFHQMDHIIPR
ncbi:16S rRNA (cytidine(1402)-2'-O)-methyltransferase [Microaerobacter geothermalis]|uniref:16S rRNA (cytidine(1402)-2'-O)-methyltransferase n=1 Tax=Microaerobacter geothermalis TaxID=674972 RepID=UPI001F197AD8|nr:16S rRNA (cytidine(1402)-2'-O)-methyltransferase [Microaerobacter geothermalis]MCF6095148.1 16S rRNA (cytidine(1402)-2'-O)-methyltransferase [Microaerobacter geothermalis]